MFAWIKNQFSVVDKKSQVSLDVSEQSVALAPTLFDRHQEAVAQNKQGDIFYEKFALADAEACYRKALEITPDYFDAVINLGLTLNDLERYAEAVIIYRRALIIKPGSALAYFNLGVAFKNQGRFSDAESSLRSALDIWPVFFQCYFVLGVVLQQQNRFIEAVQHYQKSIQIDSEFYEAHHNLADILMLLGRLDEAEASIKKTVQLAPNFADGHYSYGNLFSLSGKQSEAQKCYRRAIEIRPNFAQAYCNLGLSLGATDEFETIEACYQRAIELKPDLVEAYNNLGNFYNLQKRFAESEASYRRALDINPDFADAHHSLGILLMQQGRFEQAIACYRKGLFIDPNNLTAHSNFLMTLSFHQECTPAQYLKEIRDFGAQVLKKANPYRSWPAIDVKIQTKTRKSVLKVGLVSGDFRHHPVGFFLESVLGHLNAEQIELIAYSTHAQEDALTARIKPNFKAWNQIVGMDDETAAKKIHADGIHILIDLAGHTANNRLPVFGWKPAPVQATWLGYFASTGVPGIDYVIADPVAVPQQHQDQFTETVWYLPDTRLCFTAPKTSEPIAVNNLPALRNGYVTFASFQGMAKLTDQVLALWGRVLTALPEARLRLQNSYMISANAREEMTLRLSQVGISAERVSIVGPSTRDAYLASHAEVDMILDTFPYPGGTTTCEALWMGVPTLTLAGDTMLGLQGASLMACAGLTQWIAEDEDDYVARAVGFAGNLDELALLRDGLREKVLASPLFDAALFAHHLEDALQGMWQKKIEQTM